MYFGTLDLTGCDPNSTVRIFQIDAEIQNAFPIGVRGAAPPQTGRFLRKASSENWKASSKGAKQSTKLRGGAM